MEYGYSPCTKNQGDCFGTAEWPREGEEEEKAGECLGQSVRAIPRQGLLFAARHDTFSFFFFFLSCFLALGLLIADEFRLEAGSCTNAILVLTLEKGVGSGPVGTLAARLRVDPERDWTGTGI